jgi:hypothetical protein
MFEMFRLFRGEAYREGNANGIVARPGTSFEIE